MQTLSVASGNGRKHNHESSALDTDSEKQRKWNGSEYMSDYTFLLLSQYVEQSNHQVILSTLCPNRVQLNSRPVRHGAGPAATPHPTLKLGLTSAPKHFKQHVYTEYHNVLSRVYLLQDHQG
jgi:hypothetical protein